MKFKAVKFLFIPVLTLCLVESFFALNDKFFHFQLTETPSRLKGPDGGHVLSEKAVSEIRRLYEAVGPYSRDIDERVKNSGERFNIVTKPRVIADFMSYRGNGESPIEKFTSRLEYEPLGLTIYDTEYGLTPRRIRKTLLSEQSAGLPQIIMLGCSFTFGQGVGDGATVASYLQSYRPQNEIINLGIPTAGLNDMLDEFTKSDRTKGLLKEKGLAIYTYYGFHNERTFCLGSCYEWPKSTYMLKKTDYEIVNGELKDRGSFEDARGAWNTLLSLIYRTYTGAAFMKAFYNPNSDNYREKFALLMKQLELKLAAMGIELLIYVPTGDIYTRNQAVIESFKKEGLKVMYLADNEWVNKMNSRATIPGDGHYSPAGNQAQAIYINDLLSARGY